MTLPEDIAKIQIPVDRNFHPTAVISAINKIDKKIVPIDVIELPDGTFALNIQSTAAAANSAVMLNPVTIGVTASLILDTDLLRKGHMLYNAGAPTVYLGVDSTITTTNGIPVASGTSFNLDILNSIYTGKIYGIVESTPSVIRGIIYYA